MSAVVGLDLEQVAVAVGDERVVVPGGEQRELAAGGRPDTAHDQPNLPGVPLVDGEDGVGGLGGVGAGDLRAGQPVRDRLPRRLFTGLDRGPDPRLSCRVVTENRTSNSAAVVSTALE